MQISEREPWIIKAPSLSENQKLYQSVLLSNSCIAMAIEDKKTPNTQIYFLKPGDKLNQPCNPKTIISNLFSYGTNYVGYINASKKCLEFLSSDKQEFTTCPNNTSLIEVPSSKSVQLDQNRDANFYRNYVSVHYFRESKQILLVEHLEKFSTVVVTVYADTHKKIMEQVVQVSSKDALFVNKLNERDQAIIYTQKQSDNLLKYWFVNLNTRKVSEFQQPMSCQTAIVTSAIGWVGKNIKNQYIVVGINPDGDVLSRIVWISLDQNTCREVEIQKIHNKHKVFIENFIFSDREQQHLWVLLGSASNTIGPLDYEIDLSFLMVYKVEPTLLTLQIQNYKEYPLWTLYDLQYDPISQDLFEFPYKFFDSCEIPPEHAGGWINPDKEGDYDEKNPEQVRFKNKLHLFLQKYVLLIPKINIFAQLYHVLKEKKVYAKYGPDIVQEIIEKLQKGNPIKEQNNYDEENQ